MKPTTQNAIEFVRKLTRLAERLAAHDIVICNLHCDWATFGSWILEVESGDDAERHSEALRRGDYETQGPEVVRAVWESRDLMLLIDASPRGILSGPNEYSSELQQRFKSLDEALPFVEDYLIKRLTS
jgi:hypothetical protein